MSKIDQITGTLTSLNGLLVAAQGPIGLASAAILALWKAYKAAHPDGTEEDFIALLSGKATEGKTFASGFLQAHGFTLVDGKWVQSA